jgi:hypothetical protein
MRSSPQPTHRRCEPKNPRFAEALVANHLLGARASRWDAARQRAAGEVRDAMDEAIARYDSVLTEFFALR